MCSLVHTTENIMHSDPVSLFELRYGRSPHFLLALGEYKAILTDEFHHHEAVTRKLYPMIIHRPPILQWNENQNSYQTMDKAAKTAT